MVGTHLHVASGVDSILHQVMLVLPAMVHPVIVGSTGLPVNLKVVGTDGLSEPSRGGTMDDLHPLERVLLGEAEACRRRKFIVHDSFGKHRQYSYLFFSFTLKP